MPTRRTLEQQRDQARRRALQTAGSKRPASAAALRRAMAAFETRRTSTSPLLIAIDDALRQYPDAQAVRQPRRMMGRARPSLWIGLGLGCEVAAVTLFMHPMTVAWCSTFVSFGLASGSYGVMQWGKRPSLLTSDRDDWHRAALRYEQARAALLAREVPANVMTRLNTLQTMLLRLIPLAFVNGATAWNLQERASLESVVGDYIPDAIAAYLDVPAGDSKALESLVRQLDLVVQRLSVQEIAAAQRSQQRLRAHERFLNAASADDV